MSLVESEVGAGVALHGVRLVDNCPVTVPGSALGMAAVVREANIPLDPSAPSVWSREDVGERYRSRLTLYRHAQGWLLNIECEGKGRFLLTEQGIDVDWEGGTPPEHYLQTLGLALWLELRGVLCLHANLVARDGIAIGFLAPSQTGKSTLTAAIVRAGWQLLADDMAAIHHSAGIWSVYPSRPVLRLWPDVGRNLNGCEYDSCQPVHARFAKRVVPLKSQPFGAAQPLRCLYLLERVARTSAAFTCELVGPADAAVALLQNSILGDAFRVLGIEGPRMRRLAAYLSAVPLVKVTYPSGFAHLDGLLQTLEQDLRKRLTIAC